MVFGFGGSKKEEKVTETLATSEKGTADKAVELKSDGFAVPEPEIGGCEMRPRLVHSNAALAGMGVADPPRPGEL